MRSKPSLQRIAGVSFGVFITLMYLVVGTLLYFFNPQYKIMSPTLAPWVSLLLIIYGLIRGYRIYRDLF